MAPAATTSVQVALRIRPTTSQDAISIPARFQRTVIHATSSNSVSADATTSAPAGASGAQAQQPPATAGNKQSFNFDTVLPQTTTQHELYMSTAHPLIERFVQGFNCTILAYGQTSSGKTYSMTGVDLDGDPSDPNNGMGIIPKSIAEIFSRAKALREQRGAGWDCSIKGSFIEIYNEDLIDLLVEDAGGARPQVQIREDKEGAIIWSGLREVDVKSVKEVMALIRAGSYLRRTNETDMNAQSSRSHAIFSLTLTQRKYAGSGNPARSTSPTPAGGQSRIARPASVSMQNSRVGSPTFGLPQTPSFAAAMGRGGMHPGSSLGHRPGTPEDHGPGERSTIVSKFHFVDLAGSERLKRTAAAGERAKEGISINGGLLALGNVISALGDPKKGITHVPYRDSKLTRLLQDSLGGNAHTLMIACVSPAEWNIGETINTLKYANRARNIKNKAEIREKEEGWDNVEYLQNMVTRLREEVKALKACGPLPSDRTGSSTATDRVPNEVLFALSAEEVARLRRKEDGTRAPHNLDDEDYPSILDTSPPFPPRSPSALDASTSDLDCTDLSLKTPVDARHRMIFAELLNPVAEVYEDALRDLKKEIEDLESAHVATLAGLAAAAAPEDALAATKSLVDSENLQPQAGMRAIRSRTTFEEQERVNINLNKQLNHCEGDVRAHIELVDALATKLSQSREASSVLIARAAECDSLKTQLKASRREAEKSRRQIEELMAGHLVPAVEREEQDAEERARMCARRRLDERMLQLYLRGEVADWVPPGDSCTVRSTVPL
ncbi:kinesin-domain-containing protein [Exidia glandulosa HHB12029]|uniref:Kinesin-like protein n=1 Tax=Exidia glandulosa HHB12029 TaxID=1314781 RepID=A0A165B6B4_EXIGL|nr:kinesin-domain-containing protein [Exidia glandulosa HHB12029]